MVVWTVYLGVLVGYKYPEPALIPPTLPSACPLHHPLSCSSCSCCPSHPQRPTNPQSPVLVVLVRCPGGPGGNKRSCGGRDGRDGRPGAGYGGGAVGRSGSVRGATDRSRNRNKGTQDTAIFSLVLRAQGLNSLFHGVLQGTHKQTLHASKGPLERP